MKKILFTFLFILICAMPHQAHATIFYIDMVNGVDTNNGTATTTAFNSLQKFMANARSAGDIAIVRRLASTTNQSTIAVTSSGTVNSPLTIAGDGDNLWSDFSTSTVSATPVFGQTYVKTSASTTDAFMGKYIYFQGDCSETYNSTVLNLCAYSYEIQSASSTGIQLYRPYKGLQSGAGTNIRIMGINPQWGSPTNTTQLQWSNDQNWIVKWLDLESTNASCPISVAANNFHIMDSDLVGNGAGDCGAANPNDGNTIIERTRIYNVVNATNSENGFTMKDVYIDCNNTASSRAIPFITNPMGGNINIIDTQIVNCVSDFLQTANITGFVNMRNVQRNGQFSTFFGSGNVFYNAEDDYGIALNNDIFSSLNASAALATTSQRSTASLRSGGGPSNLLVFPPSGTGATGVSTNNFPLTFIKLFEYPIWSDASSRTYNMYFSVASTSAFTTNPTVAQMWIECEFYGDSTTANRKLIKSTGTLNFSGSTSWQTLSVVCNPSQNGIVYLRGWYGKPKETVSNSFNMDVAPVITTP